MHYFYLTLLVLSLNATHGTDVSNLKENLSEAENEDNDVPKDPKNWKSFFQDDRRDVSEDESIETHSPASPLPYSLKNRRLWRIKKKPRSSSSISDEEDKQYFLDEWEENRLHQKFQALNSTIHRSDVVNMKSARPFGVPCGDPNQHDMPWGSCTLAVECDAEYRIYRGDSFCGKTSFVCCALVRTSYDLYQGLDVSFEHENSLTTDTDDENTKNADKVKERERKIRKQRRRRRRRGRLQLKRKIRSSINKIVTQIRKLLQRTYRNESAHRHMQTRKLKKFIQEMKRQYRKDRKSVLDAHEFDMMTYDHRLQARLDKVLHFNEHYLNNNTFRDLVVNGTVNREKLTNLQRTHPLLSLFFTKNRRMGGGDLESESEKITPEAEEEVRIPEKETPKHLEYDLEYGMLYF